MTIINYFFLLYLNTIELAMAFVERYIIIQPDVYFPIDWAMSTFANGVAINDVEQ